MCLRPITLKQREAVVPCGKCPKCIARRVSSWSFRLMQEEKVSSFAQFLTMTYAQTTLPFSANFLPTLSKRDVQLFIKRLRKRMGENAIRIKYYAVGEYGGKTFRPHYHIIMFNHDLDAIQPAWGLGHVYYGTVSGASVGYTLKYMSKQKKKFRRSPDDDRVPEFALMSKGLGISYLNETMVEWHTTDYINRMYCTVSGGIKIAMPRYYKEKIYFEEEKKAIRDFYQIQAQNLFNEKLDKSTTRSVWNEQQAIDAAYDEMYRSSLKTKL